MPVDELLLSEKPFGGDKNQRVHKYRLRCTDMTDEEVFDWLLTTNAGFGATKVERPDGTLVASGDPILKSYDGRQLTDVRYQLRRDCDPEAYDITAVYEFTGGGSGGGSNLEPQVGTAGIEFAFEAGPENEILKYSLETVGRYGPTGGASAASRKAPNLNRAVNLQEDGTIEGVQIPDSPQQFSLTFTNTPAYWGAAKRNQIGRTRGKVSNTAMTVGGVTYDPGEVRFLGATGVISTDGNSTLDFRFGVRENVTGLQHPGIRHLEGEQEDGSPIANQAQGIIKEGWDYLWVYWGKGVDANGKPTSLPRGLYVERMFERADLNGLFA